MINECNVSTSISITFKIKTRGKVCKKRKIQLEKNEINGVKWSILKHPVFCLVFIISETIPQLIFYVLPFVGYYNGLIMKWMDVKLREVDPLLYKK